MSAADIRNAALGHMKDRAVTYDKPEGERSMGATVDAFTAVTGVCMTEEQGWLFMALLKAVRSQHGAYRADSYEDGAAYFALAGEAAVRDRNGGWTDKAIKASALSSRVESVDVEISEQPEKCKGCFAGCRDCCPGFAKLQDEKLARMRAASAERFVNECIGFLSEPAIAIDDSSERMQAIGQNGNGGEHYGAPDWSKAPDNAVLYIDWTGSAARFNSCFYSLGGDRFYRLDGDVPTSQYVTMLDNGLPDIDFSYFMRPAN